MANKAGLNGTSAQEIARLRVSSFHEIESAARTIKLSGRETRVGMVTKKVVRVRVRF
jgi:hypothetical protein